MATLTTVQLARLRKQTGDTNASQYDLSDVEMHEAYTEADSDFDLTIVYVLRQRLGLAVKWTDRSGENNSETRSQRWEHIKTLLEYWEEKLGLSGGGIFAGTMDLGLDEDEAVS